MSTEYIEEDGSALHGNSVADDLKIGDDIKVDIVITSQVHVVEVEEEREQEAIDVDIEDMGGGSIIEETKYDNSDEEEEVVSSSKYLDGWR